MDHYAFRVEASVSFDGFRRQSPALPGYRPNLFVGGEYFVCEVKRMEPYGRFEHGQSGKIEMWIIVPDDRRERFVKGASFELREVPDRVAGGMIECILEVKKIEPDPGCDHMP
jgi:hypothetical protein